MASIMVNDPDEAGFLVDDAAQQLLGLIASKNSLHAINKKVKMIRPMIRGSVLLCSFHLNT
ncbi:hypothetical protein GH810_05705 [Acetobacterium paludosum]|uniref:Uncharacterized protein n=1 Tax=Acetobacterium paludosum TaxID=52693 RepID=A0A923HV36_9FIRM|nr:hypothetical protein [Acetobacterium paludosum]MBC3887800.1 hypothetical protein [Acetobacterium paludosum]